MEKALPIGKIKMKSNWQQWCRLCAANYPDNINLSSIDSRTLIMAIGKYFWIDIKIDDEFNQYLCRECQTLVEYLIKFSGRVNRVQKMYGKLQCAKPGSNLNSYDIQKECGDWVHIISCPRSPENLQADTSIDTETVGRPLEVEDLIIEEHIEKEEVEEEVLKHPKEEDETQEQYFDESEQNDEEDGQYVEYHDQGEEDPDQDEEDQDLEDEDQEQEDEDEEQEDELHKYNEELNIAADLISDFEEEESINETDNEELKLESDINFRIVDEDMEVNARMPSEFKCKLCPKVYKKPTAYKRHMATTHGSYFKNIPNYQCQSCDSTFPTIDQLTVHYRTHMSVKEKRINSCPMCSKVFTTAGALNRHIGNTHKKITPYVCDVCGKSVKTLSSLKEHKLVHTDACPFECNVCHRKFKNKARLRAHSDSHTGGYSCDICGMILKTRRTLNTHRQVHSDERKCKCEVCGATFKRTKTLKSHLILHTGIRPYKCNFCGAAFSNGSNCRMHKRKKHPKELAEEESRRVIRSTRLPLIEDLNEASKRIKTPARKTSARTKTSNISINPSIIEEEDEDILNDLVGESFKHSSNIIKI